MATFLPANSKIVLVGNATSILSTNLGSIIDSFDVVVRFNNFEVEGYQQHVGSKTNIICRRSCDDVKLHSANDVLKIINFVTYGKWTYGMKVVAQKLRPVYKDKLLNINEVECAKFGRDMGLDQPQKEWATIGALACGLFANLHSPKLIWLCGFDFLRSGHYFNRPPIDSKYHNPQKEEAYIRSLGFNFLEK